MACIPPTCIICRRALQEGEQALIIAGHNICLECGNKIVALSPDQPDYNYFMTGLKKIWCFPSA